MKNPIKIISLPLFLTFILTLALSLSCSRTGNKFDYAYVAPDNFYNPNPGEKYPTIVENSFLSPLESPLSTFAIDVDGASYANVRRMLNDGYLPPADAIRLEEFINYFPYKYSEPEKGELFSLQTASCEAPWNPEHHLVRIALKGMEVPDNNLPPSNLVFLIDVSGSMNQPDKLPLLKESLTLLVEKMRPVDHISIVAYAGGPGLVLPPTSGDRKGVIIESLSRLTAQGSTGGAAGIELAYQVAQENFVPNGNNRVLLATDGDFNVGISSPAELENFIAAQKKSGIFLSVLGFGVGNYNDQTMQTLAEKGNGNAFYIDQLSEARKVLVSEFSGTLFTIAQDVKIQVEFNPAEVSSYRLLGYETRALEDRDFNDDKKDAGELGAGHTVTALYEIIPANIGSRAGVDPLKYQQVAYTTPTENKHAGEMLTVKLRYQLPGGSESKLISQTVPSAISQNEDGELKFAAAVAEFGMLLRKSPNKGEANYDQAIALAREAMKLNGYDDLRQEFVLLIEKAKSIDQQY